MISKMTGRRKHPVWIHFDEMNSEGKSKRAVCKDCKLSIVALVERMIKHKISCTQPVSENNIFEEKFTIFDPMKYNKNMNFRTELSSDSNFDYGNLNDNHEHISNLFVFYYCRSE